MLQFPLFVSLDTPGVTLILHLSPLGEHEAVSGPQPLVQLGDQEAAEDRGPVPTEVEAVIQGRVQVTTLHHRGEEVKEGDTQS